MSVLSGPSAISHMVWSGQNGRVRHWFLHEVGFPVLPQILCECTQITARFWEASDKQTIFLNCRSSSESGEPEQLSVLIVVVHSKFSLASLTVKEIQDK